MGFLDRLDDRVVGPSGQPADPRRMRAGHWFGITVMLSLVIAGFVASGSGSNPVVWPLAGMALGSLIFGGRSAASPTPPVPPNGDQVTRERDTSTSTEPDMQRLASGIIEAEQRQE